MERFDNFRKLAERLGWTVGLMAGGGVLAPLISAAAGFAPPWPRGLSFLTSLFMVITLIGMFMFATSTSDRALKRTFLVLALCFTVFVGSYLYVFNRFVYPVPGDAPVILGCTYKPLAHVVTKGQRLPGGSECPGEAAALLSGVDYDPSKLWTQASLDRITFLLLGLWLALFCALASAIGAFLIHSGRRAEGEAASGQP